MKRDDLTGLAFGGNKTRNLEFRMAQALGEGADVMIAGVEAQSNSARQTAAAANLCGMRTILLLRKETGPLEYQGNVLIDRLLGAEIRWVERGENMDRALEAVADEQRRAGHHPYVMNHASFFAIASCLAYILSTLEIHEQLKGFGCAASAVYLSSAAKGQAGVILAGLALGERFHTVGVSARPGAERLDMTARIVNDTAVLLGWDVEISTSQVENLDDYSPPGYGIPSEGGKEAIRLLARTEGILLDPVYTGKAMAGLLDHIRRGRFSKDDNLVFIHTGGQSALFAYEDPNLANSSRG